MAENKIYKSVKQYSTLLPSTTMTILNEIVADYAKVKGYVYNRYGGIKGLEKIYSVYTVQRELGQSGLREKLGLPTVYFGLAMFSALADIKSMWSNLRRKMSELVKKNKNLTDQDRHYVYTILKQHALFAKVLNRMEFSSPSFFEGTQLNFNRLNNLICRLARRYMVRLSVPQNLDYFETDSKAYTYKDGGIYLATKVPYKRIYVPLTDNCRYSCQVRIKLMENKLIIFVPIKTHAKKHHDYINEIGIHFGYGVMITTSTGKQYGNRLGDLLSEESEQLTCTLANRNRLHGRYRIYCHEGETQKAQRILHNNLGTKKYRSKKQRSDSRIKSYINAELNRMLETEKPAKIYVGTISKRPSRVTKVMRRKLTYWNSGYIFDRLEFKCQMNQIELVAVNPAYAGSVCADCGAIGQKKARQFVCSTCGIEIDYGINAALNFIKKEKGEFVIPENNG